MERKQVVEELQKNVDKLVNVMLPNTLNEGQEVKYKNYVNALDSTLRLIDRYSWELKWTKFRDENGKQFISIWEQNIDGQIRNNEKFAVDEFCDKFGGVRHKAELKAINSESEEDENFKKNIIGCRVYNENKELDKYLKTSQRMLDLFNEVKENKKSQVIYVDKNMRNIGKTYSLMEIFKNNEDTLLLSKSKAIYNNIDYSYLVKNRSYYRIIDIVHDGYFSKILLVDENIPKEEFDEMDCLGIVYCGYRNISTL